MTNKMKLSKVIVRVSMCCLSPMGMNIRNGKRMELPIWSFTY